MFAIKDVEIVFPDVVYCVIMNLFARKLPLGQSQTQKTLWCRTTRAERGRKMEQETVQCCHQSKNFQAVAETEEDEAVAVAMASWQRQVMKWRPDSVTRVSFLPDSLSSGPL